MQHLVKFLQNWSHLKTDAVFLSVSFIRAEQFLLQAQLGCGHVFSWQALSQKADWLIEAVETKFIGFDPVNPERRHKHTQTYKHTHWGFNNNNMQTATYTEYYILGFRPHHGICVAKQLLIYTLTELWLLMKHLRLKWVM